MKSLKGLMMVAVSIVIAISCTKDKIVTQKVNVEPVTDSLAILLAGAKGSSKTWSISSISEVDNGVSQGTVTALSGIPACESDNIYTFSNTSTQNYIQVEGATKCTSTDSSTVESGSWAFTDDGKSLLIDAFVYVTSTQVQNESPQNGEFLGYLILSEGEALTITQLTATSMTLTYSGTYVDSQTNKTDTYVVTIILTSKG